MTSVYPTAARDVMRFHLVYSGELSASANKGKVKEVRLIREQLDPQMRNLWATHPALKMLNLQGARRIAHNTTVVGAAPMPARVMMQNKWFEGEFEDLIPPIRVGQCAYTPLVRESLHLSCELSILFLRQQDPGALISQGGDIDGRIKTLLDALRMPSVDEQTAAGQPDGSHLYCLMQEDTLVSRLDVDTDRLLVPQSEGQKEVHLVIEVSLNVLRVDKYNMCLL